MKYSKVYAWVSKECDPNKEIIKGYLLDSTSHPYLSNLLNSAKQNSEIHHYVFYYFDNSFENSEYSRMFDEKFNDFIIKDSSNKKVKISKQEKIFHNIKNENKDLLEKQKQKFKDFQIELENQGIKNLKFIHVDKILESLDEILEDFIKQKEFSLKNKKKFILNSRKLYSGLKIQNENPRNKEAIFNKKIDVLKILGSLFALNKFNDNVLISDFNFDFNLIKDKLFLDYQEENLIPRFFGRITNLVEKLVFIPNNSIGRKISLITTDLYLKNYFECSWCGCSIFTNFINSALKDMIKKNNQEKIAIDDLKNFFDSKSYQEIYDFMKKNQDKYKYKYKPYKNFDDVERKNQERKNLEDNHFLDESLLKQLNFQFNENDFFLIKNNDSFARSFRKQQIIDEINEENLRSDQIGKLEISKTESLSSKYQIPDN